jgi:phenylpyruvate tautomerase PptA (4-oxalocrotonate tautomerase family)
MPVVSITLLPGYSEQARQRLVGRVARTVRSVIAATDAGTTVFVNEAATYQRDGRVFTQGGAELVDATGLVREFLQRVQERQMDQARQYLAPDFEMVFPGGQTMRAFEELLDWAKTRYQRIGKTFERFEECWTQEATVVYCSGMLSGVWPDGSAFDGIRFIDRFEVVQGRIRRQEVWNDLAEARNQR